VARLLLLGQGYLHSQVLRLIGLSVGILTDIITLESVTAIRDVSLGLHRGVVVRAHVAELLLLLQHALLVLCNLGTVVVHETPVHLRGALVHGGFIHTLVVLLCRTNFDTHYLR